MYVHPGAKLYEKLQVQRRQQTSLQKELMRKKCSTEVCGIHVHDFVSVNTPPTPPALHTCTHKPIHTHLGHLGKSFVSSSESKVSR